MNYFLQSTHVSLAYPIWMPKQPMYVCLLPLFLFFTLALIPSPLLAKEDSAPVSENVTASSAPSVSAEMLQSRSSITDTEILSETYAFFDGSQLRYPTGWEVAPYGPGIDVLFYEPLDTFAFLLPPISTAEFVAQAESDQDLTAVLVQMFITNEDTTYTPQSPQTLDFGDRTAIEQEMQIEENGSSALLYTIELSDGSQAAMIAVLHKPDATTTAIYRQIAASFDRGTKTAAKPTTVKQDCPPKLSKGDCTLFQQSLVDLQDVKSFVASTNTTMNVVMGSFGTMNIDVSAIVTATLDGKGNVIATHIVMDNIEIQMAEWLSLSVITSTAEVILTEQALYFGSGVDRAHLNWHYMPIQPGEINRSFANTFPSNFFVGLPLDQEWQRKPNRSGALFVAQLTTDDPIGVAMYSFGAMAGGKIDNLSGAVASNEIAGFLAGLLGLNAKVPGEATFEGVVWLTPDGQQVRGFSTASAITTDLRNQVGRDIITSLFSTRLSSEYSLGVFFESLNKGPYVIEAPVQSTLLDDEKQALIRSMGTFGIVPMISGYFLLSG